MTEPPRGFRGGALERRGRALFHLLPSALRDQAQQLRFQATGLNQVKRNQASLALRLARLEAGPAEGDEVPDDRFPSGVRSRMCTQDQLDSPWFATWCAALGQPVRYHRKLWEHAYIAHCLDTLGLLAPGVRGLGFGVGREPMVALMAARGCDVVATDLDDDAAEARAWRNTGQHASALDQLDHPDVCAPAELRRRVTTRAVDMRAIPDDLVGFDFCWSACSLEHLGSLAAGWDFVERSLATLRPGGIAVHTTEHTLTSDDRTIEEGPTVLYRQRDLEELVTRLERQGHEVAALDLRRGSRPLDDYVDVPPYQDEPHLRVLHAHHTVTSVALVVRAAPA
jgi:hypothetical protein